MIACIIPARSGSKGIPGKNIKLLGGYPLIAYSIIAAKLCRNIERTIVSTDSPKYAEIAVLYGAEVPFLRPEEISQDTSLDIEYIKHAIDWFQNHEGILPEYLVMLCTPTPLRDPIIIDNAIEKIIANRKATSLRSSCETRESPYKLFEIKDDFYTGLFPDDPRPEYYNLPRQSFPPVYHPNGYVDIIKTQTVINSGTLHGQNILSFITPNVGEADCISDFEFLEYLLSTQNNPIFEYLKDNFPAENEYTYF